MAETRPNAMTRLHAEHWTAADYFRMPDDGTRCEILEGERVMTPSPIPRHQIVSLNLERLLWEHVAAGKLGRLLHAPSDVVLADDTVVQPDIFFFSKAREHLIGERRIIGAPDLVIEILSESDPARDTVR